MVGNLFCVVPQTVDKEKMDFYVSHLVYSFDSFGNLDSFDKILEL